MSTVDETLALGTRCYQSGQLAEAEKAYRRVLAIEPNHPQALHQLGALAMHARRLEQAAELFSRAVHLDPSQAVYHANLGACYRQLGQLVQAEQSLRVAVELQPGLAQVHTMLGALLHSQQRLAEAADCYRRAIQADPRSADAHFDLGSVLQPQGDLAGARQCYDNALQLHAHHASARINLGAICKQQGLLDEAIGHFQAALALEPRSAATLTNLASTYELQGRTDEALAAHQAAVAADPKSLAARSNLGTHLQKLGRLDEALAALEQVLQADPRFLPARFGLASVHYKQGRLDTALAECRQILELDPRSANAHLSMGTMLNEYGRRDEAIEHLARALKLDPNLPAAHGNLAIALHLTGHIEQSLVHHRREIEISPRSSLHHSNLLYCLNFHPRLDTQTIFDEHLAWGRKHADPLTAASSPHVNERESERRLRVGYVSPNFCTHAVNFFTEPIFASHDHRQFEVFCYSDVAREDEATARLRGYADCWRKTLGHSHEQVACQVLADQIDILVDLTGHIGENRMPVFARKPAPVQVTYLGYQNTTGMQAMDYRLTDAYADPPGTTDRYHTETLVRLPTTFYCYRPPDDSLEVGQLPALERGFVTFASLNNFAKVTPDVLETWATILRAVPRSRLVVLAAMTPSMVSHLRETFASHGIDPERLDLVQHLSHRGFVKLLSEIDVALDPFPFNGHTTTCECLWHGVPVVVLSGDNYVSRFGASGLVTLGLNELIAASRDEYRRIVVELAGDIQRLSQLRATLRARMAASPLLDFATFTRNLETEYRTMWRRWCTS